MREIVSLKQSKKDILANVEKQAELDDLKKKQEAYEELLELTEVGLL